MKTALPKTVLLLLLAAQLGFALLTGCSNGTRENSELEPNDESAPIQASNHPTPSPTAASIDHDHLESSAAPESVEDESLLLARSYEHLLPGGVGNEYLALTEGEVSGIVAFIGALGKPAVDTAGAVGFKNPQEIELFMKELGQRDSSALTLYQVCYDGGFIRNDIIISGEKKTVRLTRVAWSGGEPELTYCVEQELADLRLTENGLLIYERVIPGNPESKNTHSGYIDPVTEIHIYS